MFSLTEIPTAIHHPADVIAGGYSMISHKYYHANQGRNALGLVGGNEVTQVTGNIVDLESDLRGITRDLSRVPARQFQSSCSLDACPAWPKRIVFRERATNAVVSVSTAPRHLPTIQNVSYPGVPAPEVFVQDVYGAPWRF